MGNEKYAVNIGKVIIDILESTRRIGDRLEGSKTQNSQEDSASETFKLPPLTVKMMQHLAILEKNNVLVLLTSIIEELRELRAIVDEMRGEKK